MQIVTLCLFLLLAVVISGMASRMLPSALPRPLVQIALGALIGMVAHVRVELDPELFFLLLVPPLLFLDGWRIPKDELVRDRGAVLGLALGLVFLTVLGMGVFIHWLIPTMPLGVAFALAAVVSPTDPIAVSAVAQKAPIPKRMMHILEGEALLNDASGLVCVRFAIAAVLTGSFSLGEATLTFAWMALAGVAIGVGVTWAIVASKAAFARRFGDETGSNILVSLLIPFAAYLAAEHVHASGVLAAAAAGIAMTFTGATSGVAAGTRIRRRAVWDMLQFTLNGVIFVLLGEQLPEVFVRARDTVTATGHVSPWWLAIYVFAVVLGLAVLRYGWVWVSMQLTLLRARRHDDAAVSPPRRIIAAMSAAGARGAITLAGALTLPLTLNDGTPFPARDLVIFLASGVILSSLVIAAVALPLLLRGLNLPPDEGIAAARDRARLVSAKAAIAELDRVQHQMAEGRDDPDRFTDIAARLMDQYRERIDSLATLPEDRTGQADAPIERDMRLAAVRAERNAIFDLARRREIGVTLAEQLGRELDLIDARLSRQGLA
ncbi:Sodium:proton antiporter [Sphingomonas aurantiaca]|uniref:Sodium/proton antiporter (CPA1 family) n=1 Tax=Sphingomonas aurantiaca TaxID=185949 RepID=A0A2T5GLM5_9SPHN|nr:MULTISPECIES: Na+/H+ antiporter [Sphingomonas]KQN10583.1 sodium:proton antiporter [Sphingomonas sp. Leaf28]PTQ60221.1 sodium/proton antiporter (CPA1 family) [Sphingomonas aurantiaca]VVT08241.1 Sodium:proton antiporter [Sphingomonas aurantiaca]